MQNIGKIDYSKLLGFDTVSDELSEGVDFQADTIGAKLGAKRGGEEPGEVGSVEALSGWVNQQ
jgi:hypothetical protein